MKTIAIYEDSKEKVVYISSLKMCYKKASNGTIFEMVLVDANGAYVDTIRVDQLNMYKVGEEEQQIIINEMDKMVRENANFIYQEYGIKPMDEQKPSTLDKKLETKKPYKVTLKEFFAMNKACIHVNNEKQAVKLCEAFDNMGKKWRNGEESYLLTTNYGNHKNETCYTNRGTYANKEWFVHDGGWVIYDFSEVCFEPKKKGGK